MSPLPLERVAQPGATIAEKYRIIGLLGRGSFGSVYEAEHARLGRRCAIKVLHARGSLSERSHARFAREARVLARLAHENIVTLFDAGEDPQVGQFMVLEFVAGQTLRAALPGLRAGPPAKLVELMQQLARGLAHAHEFGVIHRDLKPENVILTRHADGRPLVKILDFGIARLFEPDSGPATETGTALGTASYMAPEQARGERDIDPRVDIYAMGVMLYEALTGTRPFEGDSYNETIFRILTKGHAPLVALRPDLPAPLCTAVERALAKERSDRFARVTLFADALLEAMASSSGAELDTRGATTEGVTTAVNGSSHEAAPSAPRAYLERPSLLAGGVVAGLILGFYFGNQPRRAEERRILPSAVAETRALPLDSARPLTPIVQPTAPAAASAAIADPIAAPTASEKFHQQRPHRVYRAGPPTLNPSVTPPVSKSAPRPAPTRRDRGF